MERRVEHGEAAVEHVLDVAQGDQRGAHLPVGVLDVHAPRHGLFHLGLGEDAVLGIAGVVAGQVERQGLAALVDDVGVALPAVAVEGALADDADVFERLMLARIAGQCVDQRGRAHGGGIRVLDVTGQWIIFGALGAKQGRAFGDFQGHVALEVERAAFVGALGQQDFAAWGAGIDGVLDRQGIEVAAVAFGTVFFHVEQRRDLSGALLHGGAVGRFLAVAVHCTHGETVGRVGLQALGGVAVNADAMVEVGRVLAVELVDVGLGR